MRKSIAVFSLVLATALHVAAQKSEIGILAGGKWTPDGTSPVGTIKVDNAFKFELNYATQLLGGGAADLELNIPLIAVPTSQTNSSNLFAARSYSSIYLTPGLRVRLGTVFSPWVEAGVGFVRFSPSSTNLGGGPSGATSSTKAAFNVGGGVDYRPSKTPIGFRLEARELYTGVPNLAIPRLSLHNNVMVGGGVLLRF